MSESLKLLISVPINSFSDSIAIVKTERIFKHLLRSFRRHIRMCFDKYLADIKVKKYKKGMKILEIVPYFFEEYAK